MKTTLDRRDLAEAGGFVARMSPKRPTQIILGGVMLEATADELKLTVYDYEIAAETSIIASTTSTGRALVHAASLAQVVAKLPQKPVTLEVDGKSLKIVCGSVRASLPLMPAEQYPLPDLAAEPAATMSGAVFEDAVQRVAPAAATDASVPLLLGVHVVTDDMGVTLSATDRYRVAHMQIPCETSSTVDVVLAASVLREAAKAFGPSEEVELGVTEGGAVTIRGERGTIFALTLTGNFPPVERLFPQAPASTAVLGREAASEATGRAALACDAEGAIRYVFTEAECSVSAVSGTDGKGVSEEFEVEYAGDELTVALRPQFVLDALTACRAETVSLWFTHSANEKPGAVQFTAGDGFRYLLQPNLILK